ncbi:alpha-ketoglutarate-dependent dioxygenase AlkB family protein [Xanthomonas oryzae]|uniref:alpha-ketoglutarate-dependent dioxygenase AlkB family protein n=1 Tax=Xanthomonas oryzae TaxID=347 RepID=UPI001033AE70|nr:alpha-ketoglutarate-dependent dioxygenase AlkB [Xanthomonas oryzae]
MIDLFANRQGPELLPAEGARLEFYRSYLSASESGHLFDLLLSTIPWKQRAVTVWGKSHPQPRLVCWMGDESYTYAGLRLHPLALTRDLQSLKGRIESTAQSEFNSVLLNLYRSGSDKIGPHSDDEPELGKAPVIASLSLGASRTMRFTPREKGYARPFNLELGNGDLLLMSGDTQANWKHEIPKTTLSVGRRINLTFRKITAQV